ncbi:tRNA (adenosine(37)-N6)-threonylcarbamoyltransferase complex dimerization subunit type 1 TsaB [Polynucleobacter sinensis]|uniref:tRNA (adenosine(37)-N6)-threonylcarbamoyltransferase complex dimerization subunit type 1 TsaB n=1 Tax=Polynucleobacter sinensis TaxID=1743157 RepID=UPI0007822FA3|nr:tRNA (adenosine(37)-N6)-threonylcarbamoyltransferase complex dimerization subunit type 1 TsaB [Polynucleobacter sinensis]
MTNLLAIDTSSAWCSVALSLNNAEPLLRHQKVSAGASQLILPWVDELLTEGGIQLRELDGIAIGVGPGAFTGVRLGVAVVQGLATAVGLPVVPVASLDAIAAELVLSPSFIESQAQSFVVAIDARMNEVYWARYQVMPHQIPQRLGEIILSSPDQVQLMEAQYVAGSAINEFGKRLFASTPSPLPTSCQDADIHITALGVLACGRALWSKGLRSDIHTLEPLYIRNKVAFTHAERKQQNV